MSTPDIEIVRIQVSPSNRSADHLVDISRRGAYNRDGKWVYTHYEGRETRMSPRPHKPRRVEFLPDVTHFKPAGIRLRDLEEVTLTVDEVEALRLKDMEGLDQVLCADRMSLSQSTFQRFLTGARSRITGAIVSGSAIRIQGGNYLLMHRRWKCGACGWSWESPPATFHERPNCPSCGNARSEPQRYGGRGLGPTWPRPCRGRGKRGTEGCDAG